MNWLTFGMNTETIIACNIIAWVSVAITLILDLFGLILFGAIDRSIGFAVGISFMSIFILLDRRSKKNQGKTTERDN